MSDQIDVNQLSNALQTKVDLPAGKNQSDIDYVVESQLPTSTNNYTWYRLYKSGWVEQGGFYTAASSAGTYYFTIPITMSDTNYNIISTYNQTYTSDWNANTSFTANTTNQIKVSQRTNVSGRMSWRVSGISAQGGIS